MAELDRPRGERTGSSGNTAIVAIVVILLVAVIAFFLIYRPGTAPIVEDEGPDIELEVQPPADALPDDGGGDVEVGGGQDAEGAS